MTFELDKSNTRSPLISVIMPAYNAEGTLRASALSVLSQSYKELELIIIDDGSKDDTASVCRELGRQDNRVRFVTTANSGPAAARNKGLDMAKGEFVTFVDSDDLLDRDMINKLAEGITGSGADVSVCTASIEYPHNDEEKAPAGVDRKLKFGDEGLFSGEDLIKLFDLEGMTIFFSGWGKLFRRSIIEQSGLRLNTAYRITEDTDFVMRYLENCGSVFLVDECLYRYMQVNAASLTSIKNPEALRDAAENIANRYKSLMQKWGMPADDARKRTEEYRFSQLTASVFAKLRGSAPHAEKLAFYRESIKLPGFREYLKNNGFSSKVLAAGFMPSAAYVRLHRAYLRLKGKKTL